MLKKWLIWAGIAFVIFFVAFKPGAAADFIRSIGALAAEVLSGLTG